MLENLEQYKIKNQSFIYGGQNKPFDFEIIIIQSEDES